MKPRRTITPHDTTELFDEAIREHALAVLTIQQGGDWQTWKSRFLERDPQRRFFVLDYQSVEQGELPQLAQGQCVGVSFRSHSRKVLFASVVEAKGHFVFDNRTSIPAIRYRWPDAISELQRRSYYRTPVPEGLNLTATLWPGGPEGRVSPDCDPNSIITGSLADVSCGGALVRLDRSGSAPWMPDETLGAELQLGDNRPPLVLPVRYRGMRNDEIGQICIAIQFVGLEMTLDGRLALERLSACVQRFHRLSIVSGQGNNWMRRPN